MTDKLNTDGSSPAHDAGALHTDTDAIHRYDGIAVVTEVFTPGATSYMSVLARRWVTHNLWWLIILPLAPAVAAIFEPVWLFVALMITFLLYPGVLMMVYYRYALSPWSRLAVYSQRVIINGRNVSREFVPEEKWPSVPQVQALKLDTKRVPVKSGRFMVGSLEGHSRYEFILWPDDGTVFA